MAQTEHLDIDAAIKAEQERLTSRKTELENELAEINRRLDRITRYFADEPAPSFRRTPPTTRSGERHPRGFVQQAVLKTITEHPSGMTTAEIIALLKPHSIGQQSIANALGALVDQNKITSEGRGGKYRPADASVPTAPDQPSS
jgi:hypothetical protein